MTWYFCVSGIRMIQLTLGICSLKLRLQSMKMPSQHCRPNVLDFTDHGFGFVIHFGIICPSKSITKLQNCEDRHKEITNCMKMIMERQEMIDFMEIILKTRNFMQILVSLPKVVWPWVASIFIVYDLKKVRRTWSKVKWKWQSNQFLLDPGPIIVYTCQSLTHWLTNLLIW